MVVFVCNLELRLSVFARYLMLMVNFVNEVSVLMLLEIMQKVKFLGVVLSLQILFFVMLKGLLFCLIGAVYVFYFVSVLSCF